MFKKYLYRISFLFLFLLALLSFSHVYALTPSNQPIYEGIDVSNWQGYINYNEVKDSGIQIVYIKSSQGTNITDPYFRINYQNAKANGLKVGFYHYVTARNTSEAISEAEYFSSVISGTTPDCKLAMDFENFGNLSVSQINEISRVFLAKVQEITGKEMILYSDAYNARNVFSRELSSSYPLWIAEYGVEEPTSNVNWDNWVRIPVYQYGKYSWDSWLC